MNEIALSLPDRWVEDDRLEVIHNGDGLVLRAYDDDRTEADLPARVILSMDEVDRLRDFLLELRPLPIAEPTPAPAEPEDDGLRTFAYVETDTDEYEVADPSGVRLVSSVIDGFLRVKAADSDETIALFRREDVVAAMTGDIPTIQDDAE